MIKLTAEGTFYTALKNYVTLMLIHDESTRGGRLKILMRLIQIAALKKSLSGLLLDWFELLFLL